MIRKLAAATLAVFFMAGAAFGGLWENVCKFHGVSPSKVNEPRVVRSELDCMDVGVYGCCVWSNPNHCIIVLYSDDPRVLAHEYAHAVMLSSEYQEMMAEWTEKCVLGSVLDGRY